MSDQPTDALKGRTHERTHYAGTHKGLERDAGLSHKRDIRMLSQLIQPQRPSDSFFALTAELEHLRHCEDLLVRLRPYMDQLRDSPSTHDPEGRTNVLSVEMGDGDLAILNVLLTAVDDLFEDGGTDGN